MLLLATICAAFVNETFTNLQDSLKSLNGKVRTCTASHRELVRNCVVLTEKDEHSEFALQVDKAKAIPVFLSFTAKSAPSSQATVEVALKSGEAAVYALKARYAADVEFEFEVNSKSVASGVLDTEKILTHSFAVAVEEKAFKVYVDGYILGAGELSDAPRGSIDSVAVQMKNGNETLEFGNLVVGDDPKVRWDNLISSLLRFRNVERAKVRKDIVDAEEERLFGRKLKGQLDWLEEEGKLLDYDEADPRRFSFPYVSNKDERTISVSPDAGDDDVDKTDRDIEVDEMDEMGENEVEEESEL